VKCFKESFLVEESELEDLKYQDIEEWDSVGHMNLMSLLEDEFEIELDIDDIIDFSSFEVGKDILKKYKVDIK
tara:strand:+ start:1187 stop:1405 length:219 start_codon:yes stop_codon:yes gene_type:complete